MEYPGAGVELDGYPWFADKKGLTESQKIGVDPAAAGGGEKPHGVIENIFRSGETVGSKCRGNHAIFCGTPGVQSFGHGAAIGAQARGERAGNSKRMAYRERDSLSSWAQAAVAPNAPSVPVG